MKSHRKGLGRCERAERAEGQSLSEETEGRGCSLAGQGHRCRAARATYLSDVSVWFVSSAFESAAAPWLEIWLLLMLQGGNGGSGMLVRPQAQSCGRYLPD